MKVSTHVARAGLFTALNFIFLALSRVLPFNQLFLYGLTSLLMVTACIELPARYAWAVYGATVLLSLWQPGIPLMFNFLFYFGLYPLLAFRLDRYVANKRTARIIRVAIGVIGLYLIFILFRNLWWNNERLKSLRVWLPLIALPVSILGTWLYDRVLGAYASFYLRRIKPFIGRRR